MMSFDNDADSLFGKYYVHGYLIEIRVEHLHFKSELDYVSSVELYFQCNESLHNEQHSFYDQLLFKHHSKDLIHDAVIALCVCFECPHLIEFDRDVGQFRFKFVKTKHIIQVSKSISVPRSKGTPRSVMDHLKLRYNVLSNRINPNPFKVEIECQNWNSFGSTNYDFEIAMDLHSGVEYRFYIDELFNHIPSKIFVRDYKTMLYLYETKLRNFTMKHRIFHHYLNHLRRQCNSNLIKEWSQNQCESGGMKQLKRLLLSLSSPFTCTSSIFDLLSIGNLDRNITIQTVSDFIYLSIKHYFKQKEAFNLHERYVLSMVSLYCRNESMLQPLPSGLFTNYIAMEGDDVCVTGSLLLKLKQHLTKHLNDEEGHPLITRYWAARLYENDDTFFVCHSSHQELSNTEEYESDFEQLTFKTCHKFTFVERNVYIDCTDGFGLILQIVDNTFATDWAMWKKHKLRQFAHSNGYWHTLNPYDVNCVSYEHLNAILMLLAHSQCSKGEMKIVFLKKKKKNKNRFVYSNNDIAAEYLIPVWRHCLGNTALSLKGKGEEYFFVHYKSCMDHVDWLWWNSDVSQYESYKNGEVLKQLESSYQAVIAFPYDYHDTFNCAQLPVLSDTRQPLKPFVLQFGFDTNYQIIDIQQIGVISIYDHYSRKVERHVMGQNSVRQDMVQPQPSEIGTFTVHLTLDLIVVCIELHCGAYNFHFSCNIRSNETFELSRLIQYWRVDSLITSNKLCFHQSKQSLHDTMKLDSKCCVICEKKKKKEKKPRNNKEEHEYRLVSPQVWDALDELDRVYKYKPSYPEPNDVNLISWFSFWKTCHSRQQFGRNLFDAICLTRVQSVVSMLAHQIAEYTQYVAANPIIIALSNQELCYENASSRSRCHELFDHSAANMKRMDSKGNMESIFIFKFKEKVVDSDHYHTFIQRFTLRNSNAILIFTRPNCSNIYIAYNGLISLLSLALNFEDLQYFLPHFVLLSKGLSVNVDTPRLNVCDFGTVIDYALDDGGIIYNVRCTGNVHYRLNYYELFDQTPPHIYHSSKRKSLLSPLAITNLWKNKKKNGLDPSSGHVHPFHSVCLSVMESVTQCVSIMQECKSTVIEDQLQESGFILLFYRTLVNNSSKEKAEKLSNLIDQLKQKGCLAKIIKYEAPIPLAYHDLCDRFASILDRDGINNHQVLVCHLIEHQVEELVPVSTHGDGAYGDDDEDTTFIPTELHSDSDYEANQGKLKSTFECLITHECEMIPRLQSVEDLCSDYKLLTLFDACGVYSRQDLEDKSLINKLQTRSMKDEELSKTFAVFMKELNSNESHQRKRDCVQIKVGLSRNAKCLLQDIEEYNDNTLIIGYNPLQTVVVSSTSFQSVTHPIHLYRAALDHHFYPQEMTSLLWPEWMSISTDGESVITAFAALIESDTTHDVILVPSSIALRQPFLTKHCQMIAPLCGAIGEWEVLLLYKGMIYRMVNENGNQLEVVLRRLYDNIKGTQVENIAFKLLHIGCGICFFQSVNGSTTQVISSHHRSQMDFAIELRNIMFLNDIDCRIPFNTNIVTEKNKCSICHWLQIKPSSIGNDECIHTFCQRCITQWNAIRDECPMCRKKIKKICIDYEKDKQMKENIPMIIYEQILYEQALLCCRSNMISDYQYEREQQKRYEAVDRNEALD